SCAPVRMGTIRRRSEPGRRGAGEALDGWDADAAGLRDHREAGRGGEAARVQQSATARTGGSRADRGPATAWNSANSLRPAGAGGSLTFADALLLVRKRGRYMQEAVPAGVGAMAAILKLPEGRLESVLRQAAQGELVSAANFNSPEQVVIAGDAGAVNRAIDL